MIGVFSFFVLLPKIGVSFEAVALGPRLVAPFPRVPTCAVLLWWGSDLAKQKIFDGRRARVSTSRGSIAFEWNTSEFWRISMLLKVVRSLFGASMVTELPLRTFLVKLEVAYNDFGLPNGASMCCGCFLPLLFPYFFFSKVGASFRLKPQLLVYWG